MPITHAFQFPLPNGLHARPASFLAEVARRFTCAITLHNQPRGTTADMKSVLSMVAADVHEHDACVIRCDGVDEILASETLASYITLTLPSKDAPLPKQNVRAGELVMPRSLLAAKPERVLRGRSVNGGIATGVAVHVRSVSLPAKIESSVTHAPSEEIAAFHKALRTVSTQIDANAKHQVGDELDVMEVHRSLLSDPELINKVEAIIHAGSASAAQAVLQAGRGFLHTLEQSTSLYLRERVLDLQDVVMQLLAALGHANKADEAIRLTAPSICLADHLTPGQFLSLDRSLLKGLVLGQAGATSHTVILARSRGIPTLVDAKDAIANVKNGEEIILDGELGIVIPKANDAVRRYYDSELRRLERMKARNAQSLSLPAAPINGAPIEVAANVSSAEEVDDVFALGADGIGLFRTEMLFFGRDTPPSEQEQFEVYRKALTDAGGKPVIIRTFDIGGDKPAPYLKLPVETNPFLGNRGARLYPSHPHLLRDQLRALLRAASFGNLKIMVPMITCVEEVRGFRKTIEEIREGLLAEGLDIQMPPLGVMIEVPAAALLVPQLAKEVDFFSIGSNDLTQYLLATDRDHPALASLYTWTHPPLWRLMKIVCDDARAAGKWVGLCGELGEVAEALPLLVALGLDDISAPANRIAEMKHQIRLLDVTACKELLDRVIACPTREDVLSTLRTGTAASAKPPMMTSRLIEVGVAVASKEEAIKHLADLMWLNDRASDPKLLEGAIWAREETYSTGFGHGCAIPHCKSAAVRAGSVALIKLTSPVIWNSDGTNEVDLILMIALREQDQGKEHMRILSQLSRMLMRDEFRDSLRNLNEPDALLAFLNQSLSL
jgi:fructose-specific PTS system IIA-like component